MPWLPLYATQADFETLRLRLNDDDEIAFLVSKGPGEWHAVETIDSMQSRRVCMWHIPSGPLPLIGHGQRNGVIHDPCAGWKEARPGADPANPYFGAGHPGIVWLNVRHEVVSGAPPQPTIGLSSFEWIGNHYRVTGAAADPATQRWWKRLRSWLKTCSTQVPRGGANVPGQPEVFAMSVAHGLIRAGTPGSMNP